LGRGRQAKTVQGNLTWREHNSLSRSEEKVCTKEDENTSFYTRENQNTATLSPIANIAETSSPQEKDGSNIRNDVILCFNS